MSEVPINFEVYCEKCPRAMDLMHHDKWEEIHSFKCDECGAEISIKFGG